ncbi:MAG: EthD family reductase [Candidatus Obscuribacterales bacterium]|nr:EthD family reductase [Candidatus Obscuribacterales bacterium]
MVKLVALYKKPENTEEFDKHYFDIHLPLANKMPGLRKSEISKMAGAPGGAPGFYLMAELYFDDMEALKTAMSSDEGKAAAKDVMSFAKDIVTMMFAEADEKVFAQV